MVSEIGCNFFNTYAIRIKLRTVVQKSTIYLICDQFYTEMLKKLYFKGFSEHHFIASESVVADNSDKHSRSPIINWLISGLAQCIMGNWNIESS